ncbi:MAG: DNA repair protein RadA [Acidobacteriia bacterium]|nr:DNA repair protein RadA [Methyloceanibacter sp.]MBX5472694.1 DNA repair protein RadA [Acetobacteraceae bacterium]MCL6490817.1 DNA repair protein RadA [Terriglobia bacterium]
MPKERSRFVCQACGAVTPKWLGRCEACGEWNSIIEETRPVLPAGNGGGLVFVDLAGEDAPVARVATGIAELDRTLGGGFVPASAVLIGGDPGIGKSTLMLQAAAALARQGKRVLYISGEESPAQIRMRARRLGLQDSPLQLAAATALAEIAPTLAATSEAALVVIDSIQTLRHDALDSPPGSLTQVRACGMELVKLAKNGGFALTLVSHVTKDGTLAGPRALEHMVDAVLYFEGDRGHQFRILRGVKNRFGATDEIGVFEMTERGLAEVANPSALFLAERRGNIAGSAVFAGLEGTRPVLMEVQALLAPDSGGSPRRSVLGWEPGRLAMLLAVLEARCGLKFSGQDVFLNIAGGLKVNEPAADLAVAAALISAASGTPTDAGAVFFGEVGLSGEIRQVAQVEARLKEAAKLGFRSAFLPRRLARGNRAAAPPEGFALTEIGHLSDLLAKLGVRS